MTELPVFLTIALTIIGFGMLSISMDRHAKQVFGHPPQHHIRHLRTACGWSALTLALWPAIHAYDVSIGISVWFGVLAVVSTVIVLILSYRPRALRAAISAAAVCAAATLATMYSSSL